PCRVWAGAFPRRPLVSQTALLRGRLGVLLVLQRLRARFACEHGPSRGVRRREAAVGLAGDRVLALGARAGQLFLHLGPGDGALWLMRVVEAAERFTACDQ